MQRNVQRWERVASIAAGAGLLAAGWKRGRYARGAATSMATGLIARGVSGYCPINAVTGRGQNLDDTRDALGGPRGVFVQECVTIDAPVETLYALWRTPSNLSHLLPGVRRVDVLDHSRSHWVIEGPMGSDLEWDAEIINDMPLETIGWRSLPGTDVAHAGSVRFRPTSSSGTEVTVTMQYAPPGGRAGAAAAWVTGHGATRRVRDALGALKTALETRDAQPALG